MDNPEYTFQILEVFSKVRSKEIPRELEEYISYVARTGDPVFQWSLVKVLIKEKLQGVLNEFMENGGPVDIPPCPNVDLFNYEAMKEHLFRHLDSFMYPPFTIQRICELLAAPRKEYNRLDKYMRAIEKNVLVVSASDLSMKRSLDPDGNDAVINGVLYDKVNDSLSSFTDQVFAAAADEQEDELNVGTTTTKLDEPDAVQQIIDESWNEEANDDIEFKLNGSSNVSFDHELQKFVNKKCGPIAIAVADEKESTNDVDSSSSSSSSLSSSSSASSSKDNLTESPSSSSSSSSSFDSSNTPADLTDTAVTVKLIQQPNLHILVAENTNVSFENVSASVSSKCDGENFVDTTSLKNDEEDDPYEFKDNSLEETSIVDTTDPCTTSVSELLPASTNDELAVVDNSNDDVNISNDAAESMKSADDDVDEDKENEQQGLVDCQSTTADDEEEEQEELKGQEELSSSSSTIEMMATVPTSEADATPIDEPMVVCMDSEDVRTELSTCADAPSSTAECYIEPQQPSISTSMEEDDDHSDSLGDDNNDDEAATAPVNENVDEKTFSAGDNQESNNGKIVEELQPAVPLPQQSVVEADTNVESEITNVSLEASHSGE